MMLDSGARGSKEQIRQLGGMRGLMAKPQKKLGTEGQVKLSKIQFFLTLEKGFQFWNTLFQLTVLVKVWRIRHLKQPMLVI